MVKDQVLAEDALSPLAQAELAGARAPVGDVEIDGVAAAVRDGSGGSESLLHGVTC